MERLTLTTKEELESAVARAKEVLEGGGLVLYPTDTLYGIGADATNVDAIRKVFELKQREADKGLLVVVSDMKMAEDYVVLNELAEKIAEKNLPGATTLLLPKKENISDELTGGSDELGIRIPDSYFCIKLAQAFGRPYTSTSANVAGLEYMPTIDEQLEQFGEKKNLIDLVVDVGELPAKNPSTILRVSEESVEIVREGNVNQHVVGMVTKPDESEL